MAIEIDKRISFGNILTAVAVVVTVLSGWFRMDSSQVKLAEKVATIEAQITAKSASRDKQMDAYENRIRSVEIAQASQSSDLRNIQIGISEIKAQLDKMQRP
ncbi:MAG TPA: hypothetical protein VGC40_10200 [Paenirhodobacter sp.]